MKVDIEIISKEIITPSSPTPHHLRHYQLSFLDQIAPPVFMPLFLFFPKQASNNLITNLEQSNRLKKSLSEALTRFYPLAGQVKDSVYIDCNDEGVYYVEAEAKSQLVEFLQDPIPAEINKFLPFELDDVNEFPLVVQVTFFTCGGIAVGLGMSHKVGDGLSLFMFINSWAAIARGDGHTVTPRFASATFFPPRSLTGFEPRTGIVKENIVAKRFLFDASSVAALIAKYDDPRRVRPTRVEALSVFIWCRFMAATQSKSDPTDKIYTVLHAVNLRTRMDPPLSVNYFGNISRIAISIPSMDTDDDGRRGIVNQVRDSIRKVNAEYVKKLQESDGLAHFNFIKERAVQIRKGEVVSFSFTSLCRFPIYDADFGWGKPVWVSAARLTFKNLVTFIDTKTGNGIEAWINLKEEDMAKFECDEELLAHVSPTPKPNVKSSAF
ncbi:hypothetical protein FH972_009292 [Carpinus fangiana]|uniref:Uncharacterized protein n=1 Tax=Carpinus fangiana TaxID=176857 RepID=A0A5N6R1F4_9ROSI|nr:hypothetical protein FH972_009292 [Carpinus fangiana]